MLLERYFVNPKKDEKRHIIVYYCEFSSKRSPEM